MELHPHDYGDKSAQNYAEWNRFFFPSYVYTRTHELHFNSGLLDGPGCSYYYMSRFTRCCTRMRPVPPPPIRLSVYVARVPQEEDLSYAAAVCEQAGVPLEVVPLQREYWEQVVSYTVREAREGRTPNPDVMCNSRIKFGMFYDHVGRHFRHVATGHYARLENVETSEVVATVGGNSGGGGGGTGSGAEGGGSGGALALKEGSGEKAAEQGQVRLLLSPDAIKDQTYFLCALNQAQLRKALFPVGAYTKERIRELAESYDLPTKSRKDSQVRREVGRVGVCPVDSDPCLVSPCVQ